MPVQQDASIDVRHLRELVSKIPAQHPKPTETLVPRSPPAPQSSPSAHPPADTPTIAGEEGVPASPTLLSPLPYFTPHAHQIPASHGTPTSHDRSGSLHLVYSIPFSQIDLGETQVDSSSLKALHPNIPHSIGNAQEDGQLQPFSNGKTSPIRCPETIEISSEAPPPTAPEADDDIPVDDDCNVERSIYFPEASRFDSPGQPSSPMKLHHNPLAHLGGMGAGTGLSLSQVFNTPSSPTPRTRTIDSQPPPTPSFSAARMMARSMPLAPTIWEDQSSPVARTSGTTEPPEFLKEYKLRTSIMQKFHSPRLIRPRSESPAVPSSPPSRHVRAKSVQNIESDSEDDVLSSSSEDIKRRAQAARNKGAEQLKKWTVVDNIVNVVKKVPGNRPKGRSKVHRRSAKSEAKTQSIIPILDDDETGDDTESQNAVSQPENERTDNTGPKPQQPPMIQVHETQVPANPPKEPPRPDIDPDSWEKLHIPQLTRRVRPPSTLQRNQAPSAASLCHAQSMPAPPVPGKCGTSTNPVSLKHMVPFNVPPALPPTPPERATETSQLLKDGLEYVRESSGLLPSTSQAPTPSPSSPTRDTRQSPPAATHVPRVNNTPERETQCGIPTPSNRNRVPSDVSAVGVKAHQQVQPVGDKGSPNKRRWSIEQGNYEASTKTPPKVQSDLKSFAALNNSQPILSSQEDPDQVDMIGIVENVGIGYQPDLEISALSVPASKDRPTKRRKTSKAENIEIPEPEISPPAVEEPQIPVFVPPLLPQSLAGSSSSSSKAKNKSSRPSIAKPAVNKVDTKRRRMSHHPSTPISPMIETAEDSGILSRINPAFSTPMHPSTPLVAPLRVFALFKDSKLQYHPATIIPSESRDQIRVAFDDGTEDLLERECVRGLDLRLGDAVKVDLPHMKKFTYIIKGFPNPSTNVGPSVPLGKPDDGFADIHGCSTVSVALKNGGPNAAFEEIPVTNIYLIKSLWSQFAARDTQKALTFPLPAVPYLPRTASPSSGASPPLNTRRTSTPVFHSSINLSVPIPIRGRIFNGMIFALSFGGEETAKRTMETKIHANGGHILKFGFDELFHDVDPDSTGGPTLKLRPDVRNLGFTAVIAHSHSRRPKFLQALALGLPCLAYRWIDDCVKKGRIIAWEHYLLPAGESKYLHGAIKSRILPVFSAETAKLKDVETRQRILEGWNLVVVERGIGADKKRAFTFLALALGAEKVLGVKSMEGADKLMKQVSERWDCVLVGMVEKDRALKMWKQRRGLRVLDDDDLIQGLILGKLE